MAKVSSGSFITSSSQGRSLTFNWSVDSTSITGNYKKIYWSLIGSGSAGGYVRAGNFKVVIDGETVYEKGQDYRIDLWQGTVVASGYKILYHNNVGEKTFSASVEAGIYTYARNCSGSGTWQLPTIPRYTQITSFAVNKIDETSVKFNWTADAQCDYAWYSRDNGNTWANLPINDIVTGLSAGTTYNFKLRVRRKDSQLTTDSGTYTQSTYDYPHCNNTPDFIIGDGVFIGLYNPLGRNCTVTMVGADGSTIYSGDGWTGTSVSDFRPSDIVNKLYKSLPSSRKGTYRIIVAYGTSSRGVSGGTYSIRGTEVPTINGFDYIDNNSSIVAITGDTTKIVQNKSNLLVRFHSATPNYGASGISQYKMECNGKAMTVSLAGSYDLGTIDSYNDVDLKLTVTDSRGLTATKTIKVSVLSYAEPTFTTYLKRVNNYEDETHLKVDASVSSVNGKNKVEVLQYRYKQTGGSYGDYYSIVDNTEYTLTLSKENAYMFEIILKDTIGSIVVKTVSLGKGAFPLFIDIDLNSVGINCLPINENSLEVDRTIYAGDIKCRNLLYTPYTENNKLTATSTRDDHSFTSGYYAHLEKGKKYTVSCKTDAVFGGSNGTDTVEIFLLKDKAYTTYIHINTNPKTITVSETGNYFLRYDINQYGKTHSFWDFQIEEGSIATNYVEAKQFNNGDRYFLEEQRAGTWFNGKPIYRRIISLGSSHFGEEGTTGRNIDIAHNISNIENVVKFDDIWCTDSQYRKLPSNFYGNAGWDGQYYCTAEKICFELGSEIHRRLVRSTTFLYIILYYTKTTD